MLVVLVVLVPVVLVLIVLVLVVFFPTLVYTRAIPLRGLMLVVGVVCYPSLVAECDPDARISHHDHYNIAEPCSR